MLSERRLNLNRWRMQTADWLLQPQLDLPPDLQRRSRLFNILLLSQLLILVLAAPLAMVNRSTPRIMMTLAFYFTGVFLAYALSKYGRVSEATWFHGLGTLAALSYYIIATPREKPEVIYLDFRSTAMLMALPIIVTGVVAGARTCIGLTGVALITFVPIGLLYVPNVLNPGQGDLAFYLDLFRLVFGYLILSCLQAVIFERNIFSLFDRMMQRNNSLQQTSERLARRRSRFEELGAELERELTHLRETFEEQLADSDQQQRFIINASSALEELGRVARRIDALSGQASRVGAEAVKIAGSGAEVIRTNSFAYNRLQQQLEMINHSVEELSKETAQIDQAVSSVGEVAEETNLLALNASIEAAGQREHSRRFATVASEVQRLAQRSRDAAEEVRRAVAQVQGRIGSLSQTSEHSREKMLLLSESTRTSATTVNDIVGAVRRSAQLSQTILGSIHNQQSGVISVTRLVPTVSTQSDEVRATTSQLLEAVSNLEHILHPLRQDLTTGEAEQEAIRPDDPEDDQYREKDDYSERKRPYFSWRRLWARAVRPHPNLSIKERRRSRLLNILTMSFSVFLLLYIPAFELINSSSLSTFPLLFLFLILVGSVYVLSKLGFYQAALSVFFGASLILYTLFFQNLERQLEIADFLKSASGLLGVPIMVAAILAGLRWIAGMTGVAIGLSIVFAFQRLERSPLDMVAFLAYPIFFLLALGVLATFLHLNITRLTEQVENRNRRLSLENRELRLKDRQEFALSRQIDNLASDLLIFFEEQTRLAQAQLHSIREITARIEGLERGARQLVRDTGQVVQTARVALNYAQNGANSIKQGFDIIEQFHHQVSLIAANSAELQLQSAEIGQTFDLITEVADEIDLLALNATVEAAQAREAGKRFSAVASEVQRLAGRARVASTTVHLIIARVQEAVALCVESSERGRREIGVLSRAANETNSSIEEIVQIVGNTNMLITQIQDAVQQQAGAISQILDSLREIATVSQLFRDNSSASSESVRRLNSTATNLQQISQAL